RSLASSLDRDRAAGRARALPINANRFGGAAGQFFDGAAGHENGGEFGHVGAVAGGVAYLRVIGRVFYVSYRVEINHRLTTKDKSVKVSSSESSARAWHMAGSIVVKRA